MVPAHLVEHLAGWARPSVDDVVHALPDSLVNVGAGGAVEQSLIGFRVLHDGLGLAVDGQDYGPLAFLHLLKKFAGFLPEICQRLNVLRDVEHGGDPFSSSTAPNQVLPAPGRFVKHNSRRVDDLSDASSSAYAKGLSSVVSHNLTSHQDWSSWAGSTPLRGAKDLDRSSGRLAGREVV